MPDLLLQKREDRGALYHAEPGIWYSAEIKRWMITSPSLIRDVMHNPAFSVPTYDISPILDRLKIDLTGLRGITKWFPLAAEGERHKFLREKFARQIAKNTRPALDEFALAVAKAVPEIAGKADGAQFCLLTEYLKPLLRSAVSRLADVQLVPGTDTELIPQLFDDTISMKRRRRINDVIIQIVAACPAEIDEDEKYFRAALIALSANTLLGSLALTIAERIGSAPQIPLSQINWGDDMDRTSLALIEKKALKIATIGGVEIGQGERVRLFIESAGVGPEGTYNYADLFFAVGAHKCVGMSFSRQIWMLLAQGLSGIDRKMRLLDLRERDGDHVFNMPETFVVEFHE